MQYVEPIEKMPVEKWDQVLAVNLSASFHTIRLALPGMRERGLRLAKYCIFWVFVMYTTLRSLHVMDSIHVFHNTNASTVYRSYGKYCDYFTCS